MILAGALLAANPAAADSPAVAAFHLDFGAGVGDCGDGCVGGDDGGLGLEIAGRYSPISLLDVGARLIASFGDLNLAMGAAELRVDPLRGRDGPINLYLAAGPGFGTASSDTGGLTIEWTGFAMAGRVGAEFETSYGAWGIAAVRVMTFGQADCRLDPGYYGYYGYYYDDVSCAATGDETAPPQIWFLVGTLTIDP